MTHELDFLRVENARLIALLESHGIEWHAPHTDSSTTEGESLTLTIDEKLTLFRRLFRGRTDVYPIRWESKAGYSPACGKKGSSLFYNVLSLIYTLFYAEATENRI